MSEKQRQEKVEAQWKERERQSGQNIAILKAAPPKAERIRGIQI